MIDHVGLGVSDLEPSRAFHEQALAPLGLRAGPGRQQHRGRLPPAEL